MPADPRKLPRGVKLPDDAPDDLILEDDDFLEHPEQVSDEDSILDLETELYYPLFPGDQEVTAEEWAQVLENDASLRAIAPRTTSAYIDTSRRAAARLAVGAYSGTGRDLGIADRLRAYGLKVVEVAGWQTRGSSTFHPRGSVDHHTAGPLSGNAPSLGICTNGRTGLPGPLCHVLIGRDNTCYVIASGRANHAGTGSWRGITGNSNMYGVEHEHAGTSRERAWTEEQRNTAAKVHAALLDWSRNADMVCQHKEWTNRKIDKYAQTGPDMRARIQKAWREYDNKEIDMPLFKDHTQRVAFIKDSYVDIAGREVESQDRIDFWAWHIAIDEANALRMLSDLAKEHRITTEQKLTDIWNTTQNQIGKLKKEVAALSPK